MADHPEQCNCITYHRPTDIDREPATCWHCIHGIHDKCTAHKHGDPNDHCPRVGAKRPVMTTTLKSGTVVATGPRLLAADLVMALSQGMKRWAERLDHLVAWLDPCWRTK